MSGKYKGEDRVFTLAAYGGTYYAVSEACGRCKFPLVRVKSPERFCHRAMRSRMRSRMTPVFPFSLMEVESHFYFNNPHSSDTGCLSLFLS